MRERRGQGKNVGVRQRWAEPEVELQGKPTSGSAAIGVPRGLNFPLENPKSQGEKSERAPGLVRHPRHTPVTAGAGRLGLNASEIKITS